MGDTYIFIPSYKRADNIKSVKYLHKIGWDMRRVYVVIDTVADDRLDYEDTCRKYGCNLEIVDYEESVRRYDYVHRPSVSRRSAGQFRNMFQDIAMSKGIDFYCVMDDDTRNISIKYYKRDRGATKEQILYIYKSIEDMMRNKKIGVFGLPQGGDFIGGKLNSRYWNIFIHKVMNTTFYLLPYIYRGERGVQDDDTSMFAGIWNCGLMTGTAQCLYKLDQMQSAKQKGGLTDNYNENKLLNKALVTVIQYPSAIIANFQPSNGGRLHHLIDYRYIAPKILKIERGHDNIAWDTYEEDVPFTNEPKRLIKR